MNFNNLNTNQKWFVGLLAAAVVLCGVFGLSAASFQMGRMSSGRQGFVMQGQPPQPPQAPMAPAAPAAPQYQNDQPMQPQPGMRGNRGFNNGPMMGGNQRGGGFGIFGIIGGFFRLIFTIAFIGFIFFLVRRFVFGRRGGWGPWGWKGGPSTWKNGVPPHVEEWHRRMHEADATPAPAAPSADAPVAPSTDAPTAPTTPITPTSTDEGKLV